MPKKSRRLPGGKFRKPLAHRSARGSVVPDGSPAAADAFDDVVENEEDSPAVEAIETRPAPAPARTPPARPAAVATPYAAPPLAPASPVRRTGVGARRPGTGAAASRRSTSLMDLAASNYSHIRSDLARIGVLAVLMLGIIVALSFVLK